MVYLPKDAVDLFEQGFGTDEIVRRKIRNAEGQPASSRTARRWRHEWNRRKASSESTTVPEEDKLYGLIKDKPVSLRTLSETLDRSEKSVGDIIDGMISRGYNILREDRLVQAPTHRSVRELDDIGGAIANAMEMKLAVPSDLHKGSKHEQITNLRKFIRIAREQGVKHFLVPGDITSGQGGYKGQWMDQYAHTADSQLECLYRDIVPEPDEMWYVLGGNHDAWHLTQGTDVVWRFCDHYQEGNVLFLGYDAADIPLTDRLKVRMWHPSGGVPYAVSYRLQKGMENAAYEELIKATDSEDYSSIALFLAGHLHLEASLHRGNMLAALCGCFEGRSAYLARKGYYPEIGAYIFTLYLNDAGWVEREVREWYRFKEIEDDYKDYPIYTDFEPDQVEVMFRRG